ncbi:MAG: limonene-1,2-epoxide hydrolase family protein [Acidimicrobiales bacterium]
MSAADVVTAFIQAIERKDVQAACALLAEDVSYENVPMSPIVGRAATAAVLERFVEPCTTIAWPVHRQMESGNSVMNERTDRFEIDGSWVELPVVGVFEVGDDGLITLWRDYFDLETYTRQMAPHRPG